MVSIVVCSPKKHPMSEYKNLKIKYLSCNETDNKYNDLESTSRDVVCLNSEVEERRS